VLLIGVGAAGELAAKQLVKRSVGQLLVLGRDRGRANRVAERYGARAITSAGLVEALALCDVVISSTSAPAPILHREHLHEALTRRDL
jgi:glutamyl-tRNA reductase